MSNFTQLVDEIIPRIYQMAEGKPIFVAVSGGSASGKTTFSRWLIDHLLPTDCALILQDSYYKDLSQEFDGDGGKVNFDHPSSIDFALMRTHLEALRKGRSVELPVYDFKTHRRLNRTLRQDPKRVVIVDGILVLQAEELKGFFDLSFFIKTSEPVRFARRLERDVKERGRTAEGVKKQFANQVKPMHDQFVEPSEKIADLVISGEKQFDGELFEIIRPLFARADRSLFYQS